MNKKLNLTILNAISDIVKNADDSQEISYSIKHATERPSAFKKEGVKKTFIEIELSEPINN